MGDKLPVMRVNIDGTWTASEMATFLDSSLGWKAEGVGSGREDVPVSEMPHQHLKVLSLASPTGFRCDFAIPTNAQT